MHTAIALVIALSTMMALIALRTTTPHAHTEVAQWFLALAALFAIGLLVASFKIAAGAVQTHRETGVISLCKESCNVAALVNDAIRTQRRAATAQGIRVRFDAPLGMRMFADHARLASVFSSLLEIQVTSANNEGLVSVDTADIGDAVEFTIATDFTAGIHTTTFRKPFPLPDDLRIVLAERVIAAHGGTLDIEHEAVGAAIRFTIPTG